MQLYADDYLNSSEEGDSLKIPLSFSSPLLVFAADIRLVFLPSAKNKTKKKNPPLIFLVVQYEKQPPQCGIIHHSKHDNLIWVCQTFCFIFIYSNFGRVEQCTSLRYALLTVTHLTAAGRQWRLCQKKGKTFLKDLVAIRSSEACLLWK